jgi:hypothetical protein
MSENKVVARGALAGWKRAETEQSCLLTLQVARSTEAFQLRDFDLVEIAMNDRQLRSLARDLIRAADERGLSLWGRPTLKERITGRRKRV